MIKIEEYESAAGKSVFRLWFEGLDAQTAAKVATAITRMENGNFPNVKGVGGGVFEYVISHGPGYRIYMGKDGDELVILLGGGSKKRQQNDIENTKKLWTEYKQEKKKKKIKPKG